MAKVSQQPVDVFAVSDADNVDSKHPVRDLVHNAVVAYADSVVVIRPGEFCAAFWPGSAGQSVNCPYDSPPIRIRYLLQRFDSLKLDLNSV